MILLVSAFVMFRNGIFASEIEDRGRVKDQIQANIDLNNDGKNEKILVTAYESNNDNHYLFYLDVKESIFVNLNSILSGFEKEISFCPDKIIKKDGYPNMLCITGYVGAHSQNIQFFTLQNDQLDLIKFSRDTTLGDSISSDSPNFGFNLGPDSDKLEFYADNRDYNKNPLVDIKRDYYYFKNNLMMFDRLENLEYNGTGFENVGQIN